MGEKVNGYKKWGIIAAISYSFFAINAIVALSNLKNQVVNGNAIGSFRSLPIYIFVCNFLIFSSYLFIIIFVTKGIMGEIHTTILVNAFCSVTHASLPLLSGNIINSNTSSVIDNNYIMNFYVDYYYCALSLFTAIFLLMLISKKQIKKGFFVGAMSVCVVQAVIRFIFAVFVKVKLVMESQTMTVADKLININYGFVVQIANIVFVVSIFLFIIGGKEGLAQLKEQGFVKNRFIKEKVVATVPYNQTPMYNQYYQQPRYNQPMQQQRPVQPQYAQQPRPVQPQYVQQPLQRPQYNQPVQPQYVQQPRPVQPQYAQQPRPVQPQYAQQPMQQPVQNSVNVEQELRKYKSMLDEGLINQEDYDKKKAELLK